MTILATDQLNAPKEMIANLEFRDAMIKWGSKSESHQEQLWIRCSRDPVFYVDTFLYTFDPRKRAGLKVIPFILWPYQEDALKQILEGIDVGLDKLLQKSRDMGASWLALVAFEYMWHYFDMTSFLLASRKEDLVDKTDDTDTLMFKIDFMHKYSPGWLLPNIERKSMNIRNADNGSVISGESTNADLARGGRRTAILLDEFATVEKGQEVLGSTASVTECRIFNSTPKGAAGAFYDRVQTMPKEDIITMHWSLHPTKGADSYVDTDTGKLRSPWYDRECLRIANPQEIAQELDIDYAASDFMFFDSGTLMRLKKECAMEPVHRGNLLFNDHTLEEISFTNDARGKLLIWVRLDYRMNEPSKRMYVIGADVSAGTASSNSVLSVGDVHTKEKVAELAISTLSPHEFALLAVVLCKWFHNARLCWEVNGPGLSFSKEVKRLQYGNVYYREDVNSWYRKGKQSNRAGWHSTRDSKRVLLTDYRTDLAKGRFVNRSEAALEECKFYIEMQTGGLEHSKSQRTNDPTGAKENHGDRVIADALASMMMNKHKSSPQKARGRIREGSYGWRLREHQRQMAEERGGW